ncbi:radical SAM domain-containing protein [Candidatus Magnetoovum chiemensis]|nr:radical SAM domain-containing protein [Candidatus Magnetoovum chiemensis]
MLRGRAPGQLVIQYTDACNAACPQCEMRRQNRFSRSAIGIDNAKRIISHAAKNDFIALSLTGGEPLLYVDDIIELLSYASKAGIKYIRTGTNGFMFAAYNKAGFNERITKLASALAEANIYTFWISIDSFNPMLHEQLRGLSSVTEGIPRALEIFHKCGVYPAVNLAVNRTLAGDEEIDISAPDSFYNAFRCGFRDFYQHVIDIGFTIANACYPMSISSNNGTGDLQTVYPAASNDPIVNFTSKEKIIIYKALIDTIPEFRSKIRIFSPRSSLYSLISQHKGIDNACYPCRGGVDFFFVDAKQANTYPCGYRGADELGKFWDLDIKNINRRNTSCTDCDWECFRDPSELIGPALSLFTNPFELVKKAYRDFNFLKILVEDIRYFKACGYFNGKTAPDYKKLARFK